MERPRSELSDALACAFAERPWLTDEARNGIRRRHGGEVLARVTEVLAYAASHTAIWTAGVDLAQARRRVEPLLWAAYPDLTDEAVEAVLRAASYEWK